jgi:hypothetical protein
VDGFVVFVEFVVAHQNTHGGLPGARAPAFVDRPSIAA